MQIPQQKPRPRMAKKIDFKKAIMTAGAAAAGGFIAPTVSSKLGEVLKNPKYGIFGTVAFGAFLTLQKNQMVKDAGAGMIGAMSADLTAELGLGSPTRLLAPYGNRRRILTPEQQRNMRNMANRVMQKEPSMGRGEMPNVYAYQNAVENAN